MSKILVSGGLVPTTKDTLLDARTRVATFSDIANIENPARFMVITVEDTGKKYEVKKLSSKIIGGIVVENSTIDINDPEALVDLGLAEELRSEEEKVRQSNEKKRIEAENLRKSAEDSRNVNETNRASAEGVREASERTRVRSEETRNANEQTRNSNETKRQFQESTRQSQESARQNNESTRNTNESARKEAESERKTGETSRRTAELSRSSAENERVKNEQNRTTAENTRSSAEDRRVVNETQRTTNETARSNAELSREQAEGNRASTFNTLKGQMQTTIQEGQTAVAATEKATSDAQKVVDNYDTKVAEQDGKLSELGSEVGFLTLEIGGISGGDGSETDSQTNRVRTGFLTTPATIELNEGYSTVVILRYDKDKNFVGNTGSGNLKILDKDDDYLYRVSFKRTDNLEFTNVDGIIKSYSLGLNRLVKTNEEKLGNIEPRVKTIEEGYSAINTSLNNAIGNLNLSNDILLEQGGISSAGVESNSTTRVRTNLFKAPLKFELNEGFSLVVALRYTSNGEFDKGLNLSNIDNTISTYDDGYLYRITVKKDDGSDISPVDNIFKYISVGDNAIISENRDRIIASEVEINKNTSSINQLALNDELVLSTFDFTEMKGYGYQSYILNGLDILDNGNIGLPIEERASTDATQFYTIKPTYQNKGNYAVAAAVFTGLEDVSKVGATTSSLFALSLNFNYDKNANYSNIIAKGVITLSDSSVLVYQVSGRIENQENKLPSTAYARLAKSNTLKFGVSKMLVLELDEWNDKYIDIIVGNATSSSVWTGISSLKLLLPKKEGGYLERNLFSGIAFWGSSSTEGAWVKNVANNLNMPYYWGGVGGENIWAIMGRMGVLPLRVPTPFTIPASKDVPVQIPESYQLKVRWNGSYKSATVWVSSSVRNNKLLVNPCYIAGVKGNLIGSGSSNGLEPLQFQRLEDGDAVTTKAYEPIYTLGFRETRDCVWFLACHFNGGQSSTEELVELYRKMYDVSCSKKVLILGRHKVANGVVTSPTLETLQEQEEALEDEFGLMFFNTREYMCGRGFERFKELYPSDYTQTDIEQAAQGITPDCMYVEPSNVHFNDKGYVVLTEAITQRLIELGYNLFRYGGDIQHPTY